MFSGIIEDIGVIEHYNQLKGKLVLKIKSTNCVADLHVGDSIAVNGVCLTVIDYGHTIFTVEAIPETLRLTNLGYLSTGSEVNLERALKASARIGGHLVQGHVDGVVAIKRMIPDGDALKIWFSKPKFWPHCLIPKEFITIDGMSLTVVDVTKSQFSIQFIPHTQHVTTVKNYHPGYLVNVEIDPLVKTIASLLARTEKGNYDGYYRKGS